MFYIPGFASYSNSIVESMKDNYYLNACKSIVRLLSLLSFSLFLTGCGGKAEEKKEVVLAPVAVETGVATLRTLEETVTAQGILSPSQGASVIISPLASGRILSVRVREGDRVTAGQIVAVLDGRSGQAASQSAAAGLSVTQAQARQSNMSANALDIDNKNSVRIANLAVASSKEELASAVKQAQTNLLSAQTDLAKTKAGARPQEIAQAEQATLQTGATLSRAQTELERVQFLVDKGILPKRQLDDAQTAVKVASSGFEGTKQQESLVKAGARPEDVRSSELKVQQAKEMLQQAQTSGAAKVKQAAAALKQAQDGKLNVDAKRQEAAAAEQSVRQRQADLSVAQIMNGSAEIRSPVSGIVTKRNQNAGDIADPTKAILEISDVSSLNLVASLPSDAGSTIKKGMESKVTCLEFPGKEFSGKVLSVGQVDATTNLLSVRISVSPAPQLKSGLFATAEIVLRRFEKAVAIPKKSIISKEGKPSVFVAGEDGVAHLKQVEVGVEQDDMIQILKGVASGEKTITLGQFELADGAKIKEAESAEKPEGGDKKDEKAAPADAGKTTDSKSDNKKSSEVKAGDKP